MNNNRTLQSEDFYQDILFDYLREFYQNIRDEIAETKYCDQNNPYFESLLKNKTHMESIILGYVTKLDIESTFKNQNCFSSNRSLDINH